MAITIEFDKARAERLLQELGQGRPAAPPGPGGWALHDLLALAGASLFLASTLRRPAVREGNLSELPAEWREAIELELIDDLQAAIGWYAHATRKIANGTYDERFEPHHEGIVAVADGRKSIRVTRGLRGQ